VVEGAGCRCGIHEDWREEGGDFDFGLFWWLRRFEVPLSDSFARILSSLFVSILVYLCRRLDASS